jgi:flagellar biosynthesis protein FlhG
LANFDFDQAEGLRRMLAGPKPRVVTFLSATAGEDKGAMLVNLAASLNQAGVDALLLDARGEARGGVAGRLGIAPKATLIEVARQECTLAHVKVRAPQGFDVACLARGGQLHGMRHASEETRRLSNCFNTLAKQAGIVLVDGEYDEDDGFAIPAMANGEIVIQVSNNAGSIKAAYCLIKQLAGDLGKRPFGILVTGASEADARVVYDNMARAASRYLAVTLTSVGSVPADEYLYKAARLGRTVVDAFPMAGAAEAFRRLAGRIAVPHAAL